MDNPISGTIYPTTPMLGRLGALGVSGGSVFDALVGATAAAHGMTLVTRDRPALATYRALDVELLPASNG